jgi:type II secretory pathway pseudopilin PulG
MIRAVCRPLRDQRGAALLVVLVMVVIVGLVVGIAGTSWQTIMQRARETELFWRGDQYRQAIQSYYEYSSGGGRNRAGQYPAKLEDLLKDPRSLAPKKHIRRLFLDPMTDGDWELIKDKAGRITGVHSSSSLEPFRQDGFPEEYEAFVGAASYATWEFIYMPKKKTTATKVQPKQVAPGSGENP